MIENRTAPSDVVPCFREGVGNHLRTFWTRAFSWEASVWIDQPDVHCVAGFIVARLALQRLRFEKVPIPLHSPTETFIKGETRNTVKALPGFAGVEVLKLDFVARFIPHIRLKRRARHAKDMIDEL